MGLTDPQISFRLTIILEKYHTFSCSVECESLGVNINPQSHTALGTHGPPMAKIQSIRFLASDSGHMEEEKKFLFSLVAWGQGFTCRNSCVNSGYFSFIFRTFLLTKFIT